jgi:menaquinol-cytochrome c reductase iron-sulfur subunit
MSDQSDPSRRDFMRVVVVGGVVLVSAGAGGLAAALPRVETAGGDLLPLGPLPRFRGLEPNTPIEARITLQRRDGWRMRTRDEIVFIQRVGDGNRAGDYLAFSPVCPHAGCRVQSADDAFVCPCHDARFGIDGTRDSGPAPRDLDSLDLTLREHNGSTWLFVHWQDFVPGTPERTVRHS